MEKALMRCDSSDAAAVAVAIVATQNDAAAWVEVQTHPGDLANNQLPTAQFLKIR